MGLKEWIENYLRQKYAESLERESRAIEYFPETKGGYHVPEHHHASIILDELIADLDIEDLENEL